MAWSWSFRLGGFSLLVFILEKLPERLFADGSGALAIVFQILILSLLASHRGSPLAYIPYQLIKALVLAPDIVARRGFCGAVDADEFRVRLIRASFVENIREAMTASAPEFLVFHGLLGKFLPILPGPGDMLEPVEADIFFNQLVAFFNNGFARQPCIVSFMAFERLPEDILDAAL